MDVLSKLFYNSTTGTLHNDYREAKCARNKRDIARIYRVWMEDGMVVGKTLMFADGKELVSRDEADSRIYRNLKK